MVKSISALLLSLLLVSQVHAKVLHFGQPVDESLKVNISQILAQPNDFLDKDVTVSGTVVGVCSKRGCWADLASDARFEKLRIKVRDGDMVFPMAAKGRTALATGQLKAIKLDLEQTKRYKAHLAKRRGEAFDANAITTAMVIYQLAPTGVKILD